MNRSFVMRTERFNANTRIVTPIIYIYIYIYIYICNGCMPVRAVCKPHSPDLKKMRSGD